MSSAKIVGKHAKYTRAHLRVKTWDLICKRNKQYLTFHSQKNIHSRTSVSVSLNSNKIISMLDTWYQSNFNATYINNDNQKVFIWVVMGARDKVCQERPNEVKCQKLVVTMINHTHHQTFSPHLYFLIYFSTKRLD